MFALNGLIAWQFDDEVTRIERILYIHDDDIVVIDVDETHTTALPQWYTKLFLLNAVSEAVLQRRVDDPVLAYVTVESEIPEKWRAIRDERWRLIKPLVDEVDIFIPARRGELLRARADEANVSRKALLKYLRLYWRGGQRPNALLPHYDRCGSPGQRRMSDTKLGRPKRLTQQTGIALGVNLTDTDHQHFKSGLRRFYEEPRHNGARVSLQQAYQRTMEAFYNSGHVIVDGVEVPRLLPIHERPTFYQFRVFYYEAWDYRRRKKAQGGLSAWNLQYRGRADAGDQHINAPGVVYQVDATVGDIYLVSALESGRIIGRPVIYLVTDVFSHMIVGFSISLEGPSWAGAMLAMENMATEKATYCLQHGIHISEDEWPCHHLPQSIVADRGEFESYDADNLLNNLGIQSIINLPPYRPDWKGLVESQFKVMNQTLLHWLPGAVYQERAPGDKDYRLDAKLTLDDFRKLMIRSILFYNQHRRIPNYIPEPNMVADGVEPYPLQLWQWGIIKRSGRLRMMDPQFVRMGLLPRHSAMVTDRGIRFDGLYYDCETARREDWYAQARERRWKITIAYDPRAIGVIYYCPDNHDSPERCTLLSINEWFAGMSWWEVQDYLEREKVRAEQALERSQEAKAELNAHVDAIVNGAGEIDSSQPKSTRLGGIRDNRAHEKAYERAQDASEIPEMSPAPTPSNTIPGYIPAPQDIEFLRRIRDQRWQEQQRDKGEEPSS